MSRVLSSLAQLAVLVIIALAAVHSWRAVQSTAVLQVELIRATQSNCSAADSLAHALHYAGQQDQPQADTTCVDPQK